VERFVREHFADAGLNQVIVAEKFGLSIYSLSRLFSKDIGTGFSEYITALRMDQAKRLLLATDRSVGEIAQAVGIPNVNYFFRRFKECVGKTPAKFRQEGKNAQP
jgi:YesN/AraC family two-component response regulator